MSISFKPGLRGKSIVWLTLLLVISLVSTGYISYQQAKRVAEEKVMELELSKLSLLKHAIEGALDERRNILMSLRDVPPVQAILRARKHHGIDPQSEDTVATWNERLNTIFAAFLTNHAQYLQIRYIDAAGDEMVRVDSDGHGSIKVVGGQDLQHKADSHYVSETLKLRMGESYVSDVELNREHGVIQYPNVPVLRLATPVYDDTGKAAALIIINTATERMFSEVRSESNGIKRYIANSDGHFIKHPDADKTFGWERGFDLRIGDTEPDLAELVKHHDAYIRFHRADRELDGFQKVFFSPVDPSRYWLLTVHIPETVVFEDTNAALNMMLLYGFAIGLILLLAVVWFVSGKIVGPIVRLAAAAGKLQAGDLSVRVDASAVSDELVTLFQAINAFAENQQRATGELERKVAEQTKNLSAVIDHIVDGIITISERGTIKSFNPAAHRIFGYTDAEVIGQNVKILMPEPYHSEHDGYLHHHMMTGDKKVIGIGREVTGMRKDGSTFPMELAVSAVAVDGRRHFVGITRDITERKQAEEAMRKMAHYDHLTDLPNRALLHDRLTHALATAKRHGSSLALLFIDLDGFKAVNDTLGHEAGDRLLQQVAERLQACVREADTVSRLGGDEFAVILSDIGDADAVAKKADLMITSVSAVYSQIDAQCTVGCSIGIALYPADGETSKALLASADVAMYAVKNDGKNHYRFYQPGDG